MRRLSVRIRPRARFDERRIMNTVSEKDTVILTKIINVQGVSLKEQARRVYESSKSLAGFNSSI